MANLQKTAGGNLVHNVPFDCDLCDDDYRHYQLVFSGISLTYACLEDDSETCSGQLLTFTDTINTIFIVKQSAVAPCNWNDLADGSFGTMKLCTDDACSVDCETLTINKRNVQLDRHVSGTQYWRVSVDYYDTTFGPFPVLRVFYSKKDPSPNDDCSSFSDNNENVAEVHADCDGINAGTGGSVTVTPISKGPLAKCP